MNIFQTKLSYIYLRFIESRTKHSPRENPRTWHVSSYECVLTLKLHALILRTWNCVETSRCLLFIKIASVGIFKGSSSTLVYIYK